MDINLFRNEVHAHKLEMTCSEAREKWIKIFASDVSKSFIKKYVKDQFLWHICSYDKVECVKGDNARQAFNNISKKNIICFPEFYNNKEKALSFKSSYLLKAEDLELLEDVYITDETFNWTYIHTHESDLGPYFIKIGG